jgi:hypothetical protein
MPADVIKRVETLAATNQTEVIFGDSNGKPDQVQWQEEGDPQ